MGWRDVREGMAARAYARKLPQALNAGWGGARFYTRGQIDASIRKLKLPKAYAYFGYGIFLSQTDYEDVTASIKAAPTYEAARAVVGRHLSSAEGAWNADFNGYGSAGGSGSSAESCDSD